MSDNKPVSVDMQLQFHPAANLFPMMDESSLDALAQDIQKNGQRDAVVVLDNTILDGRNRYRACQRVGVNVRAKRVELAEIGGSPTQYVLSTNLHRRHLTPIQAAAVAAEALPMFEEEARKRQDEGRKAGGLVAGVGRPKEKVDEKVPVQNAPKAISGQPKAEDNRARNQAATATGAGQRATASMISIKAKAPDVFQAVKEGKIDSVADANRIAALEPEKRTVVMGRLEERARAVEAIKGGTSTAKEIKAALVELVGEKAVAQSAKIIKQENPHVSNNSGENEWYTPSNIIEAARACMGGIDTDPASSEIANKTVCASVYFDEKTNGLEQPWSGNVWMNPPYSSDLIGKFCEVLVKKYEADEIEQAIVLVNNATDTAWFHRLLSVARAVSFPKGRLRFMDKDGKPGGTPLQGQAILFIGCNDSAIITHFKDFGAILWVE